MLGTRTTTCQCTFKSRLERQRWQKDTAAHSMGRARLARRPFCQRWISCTKMRPRAESALGLAASSRRSSKGTREAVRRGARRDSKAIRGGAPRGSRPNASTTNQSLVQIGRILVSLDGFWPAWRGGRWHRRARLRYPKSIRLPRAVVQRPGDDARIECRVAEVQEQDLLPVTHHSCSFQRARTG